MRKPLIVLAVLCFIPSWASEPGELQDCSDWMQLQPGYICTTFVAPPCDSTTVCEKHGTNQLVDTHGRLLFIRNVPITGLCWPNDSANRVELVVHDGTSEVVLGTFSDRCDGPTHIDKFRTVESSLQFDSLGGVVWGNMLGVNVFIALIGLKVFPVVILGGLDSILGALVGGVIVGVVENVAAGYLDPIVGGGTKDFAPYVLMIMVLMFKPYGMFGKVAIERV